MMDVLKDDMKLAGVRGEDARDRVRWLAVAAPEGNSRKNRKKKEKVKFS